jgi:hypothetical protein
MIPWSFTHVHSSILVPRRLLVACLALAALEVSAILAVPPALADDLRSPQQPTQSATAQRRVNGS